MNVIVVGAGIGGLVTALRLHAVGLRCVVYERGDRIRELGVGINALPFAVRELAALGLLDGLDDAGVRTGVLVYTNRLGQEIMRRPCGLAAGFAHPQVSVHRGRLQGLLHRAVAERLGAGAVRTGKRLVGVEQDAGAVTARFADGSSARADVLVGADGIHSVVRSALFPEEGPPRWNGVMMWRGATEWPAYGAGQALGRTMVIAGGTAAKLVVYPIAAGASPGTPLTNWSMCLMTGRPGGPPPGAQDWTRPADPADLAAHAGLFTSGHVDHAAMIRATRESFVFPMCDRDPLPYWTRGRVTLLGDAAHPMYPMGSNGAGQAILDAVSLSTHLATGTDPAEALLAYQHDRLPPTTGLVHRNRVGGPEQVIDEVERRAPSGFARIEDVIAPAELEVMVARYVHASGGLRDRDTPGPPAVG